MNPWRVALVFSVAAVLIFGHAYDIITRTEQWPFSHYPMYARLEKKRVLKIPSLFALIKRDGQRRVVRITDAPDIPQMPALNEGRLRVILLSAWNRPQGDNIECSTQVMRDYLRMYESRRLMGLHDGPRILELRLYRLTWRLRPDGSHNTRPSHTELLLTVPLADAFK